MIDMLTMNATDVRKNWSQTLDTVAREKPAFIKRTRDYMVLANEDTFSDILSAYKFSAIRFLENDGSVTLSMNEIDLVENAPTEAEAKEQLAQAILDYALDFYNDFAYWSRAANRRSHVPYVLKALLLDDIHKIGECISCRAGEI